jgi:hypothetical protein
VAEVSDILKAIDDDIEKIKNDLINGVVQETDYRHFLGIARGLRRARFLVVETDNKTSTEEEGWDSLENERASAATDS